MVSIVWERGFNQKSLYSEMFFKMDLLLSLETIEYSNTAQLQEWNIWSIVSGLVGITDSPG